MGGEIATSRRPCVLGIDVGGTKVAIAVVEANGGIISAERIPVTGDADMLDRVATAAGALVAKCGRDLVGVGIGVPELVSPAGEIRSACLMDWDRAAVQSALSDLGPVVIEADVRAAALAEARLGAGRAVASFVYITLGTGISSALVLGGKPYAGAHGCAELLGSAPISVRRPHGAGLDRIVLEEAASGRALAERFAALAGRPTSGVEEILAADAQGDPRARALLSEAATILGSYVALMINILDPEAVVVGGGLGSARTVLWDGLVASARDHTWAADARHTPVMQAAMGPDSGAVGAALRVWEERGRVAVTAGLEAD